MENSLGRKKGEGIKDLSKKPKKSPHMMKMYWQFKIKAIAEKAAADNKRINGAMIKRQYNIPYSVTLFFIYDKIACFLIRRIPSLFISQKIYQLDTAKLTVEKVKTIVWRYTFAYYNTK